MEHIIYCKFGTLVLLRFADVIFVVGLVGWLVMVVVFIVGDSGGVMIVLLLKLMLFSTATQNVNMRVACSYVRECTFSSFLRS